MDRLLTSKRRATKAQINLKACMGSTPLVPNKTKTLCASHAQSCCASSLPCRRRLHAPPTSGPGGQLVATPHRAAVSRPHGRNLALGLAGKQHRLEPREVCNVQRSRSGGRASGQRVSAKPACFVALSSPSQKRVHRLRARAGSRWEGRRGSGRGAGQVRRLVNKKYSEGMKV